MEKNVNTKNQTIMKSLTNLEELQEKLQGRIDDISEYTKAKYGEINTTIEQINVDQLKMGIFLN